MASLGLVALAAPASAVIAQDPAGDAHRNLDIVRVDVTERLRTVRTVVTTRGFAHVDSAARVPTITGVHYDTAGDAQPEHLIKLDGMHVAAGSTRGWDQMRSNGFDPWGDWTDCAPTGWGSAFLRFRPAREQIVFDAPKSCLGRISEVRVAVRTYKPHGVAARSDWARGARKYVVTLPLD